VRLDHLLSKRKVTVFQMKDEYCVHTISIGSVTGPVLPDGVTIHRFTESHKLSAGRSIPFIFHTSFLPSLFYIYGMLIAKGI